MTRVSVVPNHAGFRRRRLEQNETYSTIDYYHNKNNHKDNEKGQLVFLSITVIMLTICLATVVIKIVCYRVFGIRLCHPLPEEDGARRTRRPQQVQQPNNNAHGDNMDNNDDNEQQEKERILAKQRERREWYQIYLQPFTIVAKETDFAFTVTTTPTIGNADLDNSNILDTTINPTKPYGNNHQNHDIDNNGFDNFGNNKECSFGLKLPSSVSSSQNLPSPSNTSNTRNNNTATAFTSSSSVVVVAASCAICLGDYEVGDSITWASQPNCRHAFHNDCILTWLSKGKKRCPICRHWFVPKTFFDELVKQQPHQQQVQDRALVLPIIATTTSTATREVPETDSDDDDEDNDDDPEGSNRHGRRTSNPEQNNPDVRENRIENHVNSLTNDLDHTPDFAGGGGNAG